MINFFFLNSSLMSIHITHFIHNIVLTKKTVWKHFLVMKFSSAAPTKTLCIHPIWMWDAVNGGLKPQPWHHNIIQARPYPIFPKNHPHLNTYYSIRMHPYAHPQHLKVLKHCVYPIWMWDAVNGGLQPQPWSYNIIQARLYPIFPTTHPHLHM